MQPELFDWNDPDVFIKIPPPKKKRKRVDYDELYKMLLAGPVTFKDIQEATGVSHSGVSQVITTLCLKYPVWSPKRGVYKLCQAQDYTTVNPNFKL